MEKRTYRPVQPSDLPQIQSGKLKAFYDSESRGKLPAKLISTRWGADKRTAFLVEYPFGDAIEFIHIVVDVTPEKRYAVWSHKAQRFVNLDDVLVNKGPYGNKADAEVAMEEMFKKYATSEKQQKQFYVVEWEIKSDD